MVSRNILDSNSEGLNSVKTQIAEVLLKKKCYMQNNPKTSVDMHSNPQMRSRLQVFWSIVMINFFFDDEIVEKIQAFWPKMRKKATVFPLLWWTEEHLLHVIPFNNVGYVLTIQDLDG